MRGGAGPRGARRLEMGSVLGDEVTATGTRNTDVGGAAIDFMLRRSWHQEAESGGREIAARFVAYHACHR
jgi:hypothetical protein